jgi:hypothetical protein
MATVLAKNLNHRHEEKEAPNDILEVDGLSHSNLPTIVVSELPISLESAAAKPDASPTQNQNQKAPKSKLRWKLTLMVALFIPVFLETLDYTG